jgi:hypothetical protein
MSTRIGSSRSEAEISDTSGRPQYERVGSASAFQYAMCFRYLIVSGYRGGGRHEFHNLGPAKVVDLNSFHSVLALLSGTTAGSKYLNRFDDY